jgi:hypothetical protein
MCCDLDEWVKMGLWPNVALMGHGTQGKQRGMGAWRSYPAHPGWIYLMTPRDHKSYNMMWSLIHGSLCAVRCAVGANMAKLPCRKVGGGGRPGPK